MRCSLRRLALVLSILLPAVTAPARAGGFSASDAHEMAVPDPNYGQALFDFYRGQTLDALIDLDEAQALERRTSPRDEAELLRGRVLLSYGLPDRASAVLERVAARAARPEVRGSAAYFLARIRFEQGQLPRAAEALAQIAGPLPGPLDEGRQLLVAQVRLAQNDFAGAAMALKPMPDKQPGPLAARINLGIALLQAGRGESGRELLDDIGQLYLHDDAGLALRDRANVALGLSALMSGRAADAREILRRVRLLGPESAQALLAFGWAADEMTQPQAAFVAWQELASRDTSEPEVLEALLAVPYACRRMGSRDQAQVAYREALRQFARADANLDAAIDAMRDGRLVDSLIAHNPDDPAQAGPSFDDLPPTLHARSLIPVLADPAFQQGFRNLRELLALERRFTGWQKTLDSNSDTNAAVAARVASLHGRLEAMVPRVHQAAQSQRNALGDLAMNALQAQKARVAEYTSLARLALAQLLDHAAGTP